MDIPQFIRKRLAAATEDAEHSSNPKVLKVSASAEFEDFDSTDLEDTSSDKGDHAVTDTEGQVAKQHCGQESENLLFEKTPFSVEVDVSKMIAVQQIQGPRPADISNNQSVGPFQPQLRKFPKTLFGSSYRSFNPKFYKSYPWVEYSISENAVYCFCCRHFPDESKTAHEKAFTKTGFHDWKHATGKKGALAIHQRSKFHVTAASVWRDYQKLWERNTSVLYVANEAHVRQVCENRHYLSVLASVLRLTALQQISQRGHEHDGHGQGNVQEIMGLISTYDPIVRERIMEGPRNSKYLHHDIQNEFLTIMASVIKEEIAQEVCKSGSFALIVDETKDISKTEQLSLVLRYVFNNVICEEFIGYQATSELDAESLLQCILSVLKSIGVDVQLCVAQCYDCVSVVSGKIAGVQAKLRAIVPFSIYVHCHAHRLNLVVVDCVKNIKVAGEFFAILQQLYVFMAPSTVHQYFKQLQEEKGAQPVELKRLSDTRWICQHVSCYTVHYTLPFILDTLSHFSEDTESSERRIEGKLLLSLLSANFCVLLILFEQVLLHIEPLAKMLLSPSLDMNAASELISSCIEDLDIERNMLNDEGMWHTIKQQATKLIKENQLVWEKPKQRCKLQQPLDDSLVSEVVGSRTTSSGDSFAVFCHETFIPVLDRICSELRCRFSAENCNIMKSLSHLNPKSDQFLNIDGLKFMAEIYLLNLDDLKAECHSAKRLIERKSRILNSLTDLLEFLHPYRDAFSELFKLLQIAVTLPVSSAGCERTFSKLRMIKTYLCNSMADNRLDSLGTIAMNRQRAENLNLEDIVLRFAAKHRNRKIAVV